MFDFASQYMSLREICQMLAHLEIIQVSLTSASKESACTLRVVDASFVRIASAAFRAGQGAAPSGEPAGGGTIVSVHQSLTSVHSRHNDHYAFTSRRMTDSARSYCHQRRSMPDDGCEDLGRQGGGRMGQKQETAPQSAQPKLSFFVVSSGLRRIFSKASSMSALIL